MEPESNASAPDRDLSSNHGEGGLLAHVEARLRSVVTRPSIQAELAWRRILRTAVLIRRPLQSRNVILFLIAAVLAGSVVALLQSATGLPSETTYMAGIFIVAALLWVTEALPLFATALLVVGLEVLLLANPGGWAGLGFEQQPTPDYRVFLAPIADPIIILFFGGFLLARASVKEGVDRALAGIILRVFRGRPLFVMLGLMMATALFSMWMSNTAATAMMITLVGPMLAQISDEDRIRKGLVLAIPFAANIGGMGTPISSPPNAVAVGFLSSAGYDVTFLDWMLVAVPLAAVLLLAAWLLLWTLFSPHAEDLMLEPVEHRVDGRGLFVLGVIALTIGLWLTDRWHGLPTAVVALVPAIAFTATGLLDQNDVNSLEWNILILIAGGIALGVGMQRTGLDQVLVQQLPAGGPFVLVGMILATLLISTFMSNTAAANLILPVGISFAASVGAANALDPVQMGVSIALVASMAMGLPVSTPPNAIAYASGELAARDFSLAGTLLGVLAAVLIGTLGGPIIGFWMAM
jgi:sodium-dependent dicarboxylate transporter 2/3/5